MHFDKNSIDNIIALVGFLIATITSLVGIVLWYVEVEKKRYGLERDLAHIKNSYEQLGLNIRSIIDESDYRFDTLDEKLESIDRVLVEMKSILSLKS